MIAGILTDLSVWSIVIFVAGVVLMILEIFHPGFGALGISGIVCFVITVVITADTLAEGFFLTAVMFVLVALMVVISAVLFSRGHMPKMLVLTDATSSSSGFSGVEDMQYLLGKSGKAITDLRPVGMADFDGVRLDVVSRGDYIDRGTDIEVMEVESNRIVVKRKD